MSAILKPHCDNQMSQSLFLNTLLHWMNTPTTDQLTILHQSRRQGYTLHIKTEQYNVWLPTVENIVVPLDGSVYHKPVLFRCMNDEACFEIHCDPSAPYNVLYIEIDMIEQVGSSKHAQHLQNIMELATIFSVPVHYLLYPEKKSTRLPFTSLQVNTSDPEQCSASKPSKNSCLGGVID